jgi:serine/threonine-protein kinase
LIQVMGTGPYSLEVAVTPTSRPSREQTQRVTFAKDRSGTTVTGKVAPNEIRRYLMEGKQGQILVVKVLQGKVDWSAIAPDGQRIGGSATNSKDWKGRMPNDGDYVIEVTTRQPGQYALSLEMF